MDPAAMFSRMNGEIDDARIAGFGGREHGKERELFPVCGPSAFDRDRCEYGEVVIERRIAARQTTYTPVDSSMVLLRRVSAERSCS